jgi:hypothetical protein
VGDVGDVDPEDVLVVALLDRQRVVEVLGVDGVGRPRRHVPEVASFVDLVADLLLDVLGPFLGLREHRLGELVADLELLEQLLAVGFESVGQFRRNLDRALSLGGAGLGLGVARHTERLRRRVVRRIGAGARLGDRRSHSPPKPGVAVARCGGRASRSNRTRRRWPIAALDRWPTALSLVVERAVSLLDRPRVAVQKLDLARLPGVDPHQ